MSLLERMVHFANFVTQKRDLEEKHRRNCMKKYRYDVSALQYYIYEQEENGLNQAIRLLDELITKFRRNNANLFKILNVIKATTFNI
jgi:hemerythrin-like domain-containing protein